MPLDVNLELSPLTSVELLQIYGCENELGFWPQLRSNGCKLSSSNLAPWLKNGST